MFQKYRVIFQQPSTFGIFWKDLEAPSSTAAALLAKAERAAQGQDTTVTRIESLQ